MKKTRLIQYLNETPWGIRPGVLRDMCDVARRIACGESVDSGDTRAFFGREAKPPEMHGAVAVMPLFGPISQRLDIWGELFGGASTIGFGQRFRKAMADDSVSTILINIDSPGGSVFGVEELAAEIFAARSKKKIVAVANSTAASAAYWIAAAATEIVVTPGGEVGSIGVWSMHQDISKALDEAGIKMTLISAGKFKTEGNPFEPLDDVAREAMQSRTDDYFNAFVKAVAKFRGVSVSDVRNGFGEGRTVGAREAVQLGMADRVASFDDTVSKLVGRRRASGAQASDEDLATIFKFRSQPTPAEDAAARI